MPGVALAAPGTVGGFGSQYETSYNVLELFNELAVGSAWSNQTGLADGGANGTGTWLVAATITADGLPSSQITCTASSSFNRTVPIGVINPAANVPGQYANRVCMIAALQISALPTSNTSLLSMKAYVGGVATNMAQLMLTTTGSLRTRNNVTAVNTDSATVISTGTTYYVTWMVDAAAKRQNLRVYDSTGSLLEEQVATANSYTQGLVDHINFGLITPPGNALNLSFANVGYRTDGDWLLPPVSTPPVTGTATLAGASSVTDTPSGQSVTASLAAAGAIAAPVVLQASVTIAGVSSLSAPATQRSSAAPTATGAMSALAVQSATTTLSGAGSVTAAAVQRIQGTAALAGAGAVTGLVTGAAVATITGAGALTSAVVQRSTTTLTGAAVLTDVVTEVATATVTGAGALTSPAVQSVTAALAGAGAISSPVVQRATATLTGAGAVTGVVTQRATATATAAGVLTASVAMTVSGTASVTGAGFVTAPVTQPAAAAPTAAGAVTATAVVIVNGTATVAAASTATSAVVQGASCTTGATAALIAAGAATLNATATVQGQAVLAAIGTPRFTYPTSGRTDPTGGHTAPAFAGVTNPQ